VPTQEWSQRWTDEALYTKYDITDDEIAFIEKVVRPMEVQGSFDEEIQSEDDDLDDE
jgi:site-specific DNA-methyltransferase (adenine-specific)